jgi:hypothetical protein
VNVEPGSSRNNLDSGFLGFPNKWGTSHRILPRPVKN